MSPRLGARLLAVLLSAAVVLTAPVAAHAERLVTRDAAGDVVRVEYGEGDDLDNSVVTPAPDVSRVDITSTVVDHRASRLRFVVRYRDVEPTRFALTLVQLRTPAGRFEATMMRMRGERTVVELDRTKQGPVECEGFRMSLDRTSDRLTTVIPTSCLGAPRWVQVGVGSVVLDGAGPEDAESAPLLVDDGHLTGSIREDSVALGPRVYRG